MGFTYHLLTKVLVVKLQRLNYEIIGSAHDLNQIF